jgi:hypothetical protein
MKHIDTRIETLRDGAFLHILRRGKLETRLRLGPNHVHAFITRRDGSVEDLGISTNLLTNAGRDLWAAAFGQAPNKQGAFTATSATSATPSGGGLTADQYKGWRVFSPISGVTTPPVYGNIGTNSTTVLTVDQWWTDVDGLGTTPASTNGYFIMPTCLPRFMALTTDAAAASAADTVLATENNGNGCSRTKAAYAHTAATATYTMQVVYSITGTITALHKMGLFTNALPAGGASGGVMVFETVLNLDATVGNGDTLTVTDTITLTG